ncbi:hypothetical protein [Paenibacillus jiagnxiensis]|uniref:hypothetical protein n=1 Tax=Paenibacillus jiagnxiensis TaxID=3228926 RepID=UPI0033B89758
MMKHSEIMVLPDAWRHDESGATRSEHDAARPSPHLPRKLFPSARLSFNQIRHGIPSCRIKSRYYGK